MVESENNCRSVVQYTFMRKILGSWIPPKNPNKILNKTYEINMHLSHTPSPSIIYFLLTFRQGVPYGVSASPFPLSSFCDNLQITFFRSIF